MAINQIRIPVTAAATVIATNDRPPTDSEGNKFCYLLKNAAATIDVYLGDANVTTSTGLLWGTADPPVSIDLEAGETLYGITTSGTATIHVLRQGR